MLRFAQTNVSFSKDFTCYWWIADNIQHEWQVDAHGNITKTAWRMDAYGLYSIPIAEDEQSWPPGFTESGIRFYAMKA